MHKINLKLTNRKKVTFATLFIAFFGSITILLPMQLIYIIPQSGLGNYFLDHQHYAFITVPILIYFAVTGVYFYKIKIDSYIIDITSYRTISGVFNNADAIDISHSMLINYSFFDRPFSFNKTLMLKIETTSGKKIAKRFNLTLISRAEIKRISNILDRIIVNNN